MPGAEAVRAALEDEVDDELGVLLLELHAATTTVMTVTPATAANLTLWELFMKCLLPDDHW